MTYELAKELKEAGFPQKWTSGKFYAENDAEFKDIAEYQHKLKFVDNAHKFISIPTLSELIEACGDKLYSVHRITDFGDTGNDKVDRGRKKWIAVNYVFENGTHKVETEGRTIEEAVARLWLALNKKSRK